MDRKWRDLLDRLAREHPLVDRTASWLCFAWPTPTPGPTVQVTCAPANGLMRLVLTADICAADEVPARAALELAGQLLLGGVLIRNRVLSIRHVFTEGRFTAAELSEAVLLLRDHELQMRDQLARVRRSAAGT